MWQSESIARHLGDILGRLNGISLSGMHFGGLWGAFGSILAPSAVSALWSQKLSRCCCQTVAEAVDGCWLATPGEICGTEISAPSYYYASRLFLYVSYSTTYKKKV